MSQWFGCSSNNLWLSIDQKTGDQCLYRHALPPGFVLRSQRKALDEAAKANTITLEEFLEVEVGEFVIQLDRC